VSPLAAGETVSFPAAGVGTVPQSGVSDVYVVINAISPSTDGCLDDYDAAVSDPGTCTVSFDSGNNASDSDIVASSSGSVSVTNTSSGTVDVAVTVMGYYQAANAAYASSGDTYVAVPQTQIVDTRSGLGAPEVQVAGGGSLTVQVGGEGGVPSNGVGAALYIGAANASSTGYVSAYPTGGTASSLSLLSYVPGQVVHDLYFGGLSASGNLTLVNQGSGPVDLMVGVQGYLDGPTASPAGSTYQDVPEARIVDTRNGTGGVPSTPVPAGGSITFAATGADGVPSSGVSAVAESIRAMSAQDTGYLSEYAAGSADPDNPGVNFYANGNQDNDLTATSVSSVGTNGEQTITNHSSGTVNIVVTIRGYYRAPTVPTPPDLVQATVSGQTATVTWQAPTDGDGGSPITSYTITAPPDTVTATVSGSTYQVQLTGLASATSDVYTVTANNALGSSANADQEIGNIGQTDYEQDVGVSLNVDTNAQSVTDDNATMATVNSDGSVTTQAMTPTNSADMLTDSNSDSQAGGAPAASLQECGPPKTNANVVTHPNFNNSEGGTSHGWYFEWLNHLYSISNAFKDSGTGVEQWLGIQCSAGGGHTTSGSIYNAGASLSENAIFTNSTNKKKTLNNQDWGVKATSSTSVTDSLSFTVTGNNNVTIGGGEESTTVVNDSEDAGSDGGDGHYGTRNWPNWATKYDVNRINAEWQADNESGRTGSTNDWVGNTSIGIWQYPQGSGSHDFYSIAVVDVCRVEPGACKGFGGPPTKD
jgi:Fibronectin type III domain